MSFRNRCTLAGPNGPINLSIPLAGGRGQKTAMKEVLISNKEKWQMRHWKTMESCYSRSPFFDHYRDELRQLFSRKFDFLAEWNLECMRWTCDKMAIRTECSLSESFLKEYNRGEFTDYRNHLMPSTINALYPSQPRYPQVFEDRLGFLPNLSVLDRLFCNGNAW